MTIKQKILKLLYSFVMMAARLSGKKCTVLTNDKNIKPRVSFYSLKAISNRGSEVCFDSFKGKKVLLVNTASECGYTAQYEELERLQRGLNENIVILGFPSNDFKNQEKSNDEEISAFCKINYGITFTIMKKSCVKGEQQNEVFNWLSNESKNGWNNQAPEWNFSKYLVNEHGVLTHYFGPAISPLSHEVKEGVSEK